MLYILLYMSSTVCMQEKLDVQYMKSSFAKTDNSVFKNPVFFFIYISCIPININQTAVGFEFKLNCS